LCIELDFEIAYYIYPEDKYHGPGVPFFFDQVTQLGPTARRTLKPVSNVPSCVEGI
jgi:hypothetical protein